MSYIADEKRYDKMIYRRCGKSGLLLPAISLGFWHNFGDGADFLTCENIVKTAFDNGITYFDLANNYGPKNGSAETNFGKIFSDNFVSYRDEIIIATKAGWKMWEGPYGDFGSKKYLFASLEQSLKRMKLDYVDIFYHHRFDPKTPLEETACTLDLMVKQGKALYVGISNYSVEETVEISKIFKELKTPFIVNQPCYNMFNREVENGLIDTLNEVGAGMVVYSPLAQGLLTDRYAESIPENSRAKNSIFLNESDVISSKNKVAQLREIANKREQTTSQLALSWLINNKSVTSVIIGASSVSQLEENLKSVNKINFTKSELKLIEDILK